MKGNCWKDFFFRSLRLLSTLPTLTVMFLLFHPSFLHLLFPQVVTRDKLFEWINREDYSHTLAEQQQASMYTHKFLRFTFFYNTSGSTFSHIHIDFFFSFSFLVFFPFPNIFLTIVCTSCMYLRHCFIRYRIQNLFQSFL